MPGAKEIIEYPSGAYEFIHNIRPLTGGYKACSLFSPMNDFRTQAQASDVAREVMNALFQEEHRAETDRSAEIRAAREAEITAAEEAEREAEEAANAPAAPSRRQLIGAGPAKSGA